jgi:hypothetical protein
MPELDKAGKTIGRRLMAMVLIIFAAGCTAPRAVVEPEGRLDVFNPDTITGAFLPRDWVIDGPNVAGTYLSTVVKDKTPALKIVNGEKSFIAVRRTQAMLLASSFLTWAWYMETPSSGAHPARLVIGFQGGGEKSRSWESRSFTWLDSPLPLHDRALAIVWGSSALQRGTIVRPAKGWPRYIARGGRENGGKWWLEYLDLAGLYRRLWPGDDLARVRIAFIGVAAAGGKPPSAAYISKIVISR